MLIGMDEKSIGCHKNRAYRSFSGLHLSMRLELLDTIDRYFMQGCSWDAEYSRVIPELAEGIIGGTIDRYVIHNDNHIERIYGITDYHKQTLLSQLAFFHVGCRCSDYKRVLDSDFLEMIEDKYDYSFFLGFRPSAEILSDSVAETCCDLIQVIESSRYMHGDRDYLRLLCDEIDGQSDDDEIIKNITPYNDGSYLALSPRVSALASILLHNGEWNEFFRLIIGLKYYPLQGSLILMLRTVEELMTIIRMCHDHGGCKVLLYILRDSLFKRLLDERKYIHENLSDESLTAGQHGEVERICSTFESEQDMIITELMEILLDEFGKADVTEWLAKHKRQAENKHLEISGKELELLAEFESRLGWQDEEVLNSNVEDMSYDALLLIADKVQGVCAASKMIDAFGNAVFSDLAPVTRLTEVHIVHCRSVYRCLHLSGRDGLQILKDHLSPSEGFNVNLSEAMRNHRQAIFWMFMLILSLEKTSDVGMFMNCSDILFRVLRDCEHDTEALHDVFYLAECVVCQILQDCKDGFEQRLIKTDPDLFFVLRILVANNGIMSGESVTMLVSRIHAEWHLEQRILKQKGISVPQEVAAYVEKAKILANHPKIM